MDVTGFTAGILIMLVLYPMVAKTAGKKFTEITNWYSSSFNEGNSKPRNYSEMKYR